MQSVCMCASVHGPSSVSVNTHRASPIHRGRLHWVHVVCGCVCISLHALSFWDTATPVERDYSSWGKTAGCCPADGRTAKLGA
jgi:hypothetical protein